jgi:hypothetical protein
LPFGTRLFSRILHAAFLPHLTRAENFRFEHLVAGLSIIVVTTIQIDRRR